MVEANEALALVSGHVNQELLVRKEYLAAKVRKTDCYSLLKIIIQGIKIVIYPVDPGWVVF